MLVLPPHQARIKGVETEYGVTYNGMQTSSGLQNALSQDALVDSIEKQFDGSTVTYDGFNQSGSRYYLDGDNIEVATAETLTVDGLTASYLAGQQAVRLAVESQLTGARLHNRSMTPNQTTRGEHENYLVGLNFNRKHMLRLASWLAVSSVVFGPGYVSPTDNSFLLDQRAWDMFEDLSKNNGEVAKYGATGTKEKPFFKTLRSGVTLSPQNQRLEIVKSSHNTNLFCLVGRTFTTSLVLRPIEHGAFPDALLVADPYEAIHIAGGADGDMQEIQMLDGSTTTAPALVCRILAAAIQFGKKNNAPRDEIDIAITAYELAQSITLGTANNYADHIEWIRKKQIIEKYIKRGTANAQKIQQLDHEMHVVDGPLNQYLKSPIFPSSDLVSFASREPLDLTRAKARSILFQRRIVSKKTAAWHYLYKNDLAGTLIPMTDPYEYTMPS